MTEEDYLDMVKKIIAQARYQVYCLFEKNPGLAEMIDLDLARAMTIVCIRLDQIGLAVEDSAARRVG